MNSTKLIKREMPYSHLIQSSMPIIFTIVWILDSFLFQYSIILNNLVPILIRIILFAVVLITALILIQLAHKALFQERTPSNTMMTAGILKYVRNPMYLGVLLIYLAFILLSISLICIVLFIIITLIYNKLVNYEEKVLETLFGNQYIMYKKKVPKWIPKIV